MTRYFLYNFSESLFCHKLCSITALPYSSVLPHTCFLKQFFAPAVDSVDAAVDSADAAAVFCQVLKESLPETCFSTNPMFYLFKFITCPFANMEGLQT